MKKKSDIETFQVDINSDGKFKVTYEGTPIFLVKSIVKMIEHIVSSNTKVGHMIVTGLIGGMLSLDCVSVDEILKELDSITEDNEEKED